MKQPDPFWQYVQDAFDKCQVTLDERNKEYNNQIDIRHYWIHSLESIFDKMWGKMLRIKSAMALCERRGAPVPSELRAHFLDSCIDLINYTVFMYAEQLCLEQDNNPWNAEITLRRIQHATPQSTITPRTRESVANPVERVVLDEGSGEATGQPAGSIRPLGLGDSSTKPVGSYYRDTRHRLQRSDHTFNSEHVGACPACTEHAEGACTDPGVDHTGMGTGECPQSPPGTDSEDA